MAMATALMGVGLAISAGTTAFSIYNGIETADAQAEQARINAEYQNAEAKRQASILSQNAQIEEAEARRKQRRNRASMEAQYASSGVTMTGSPSEFLAEQAMYDEYNIELMRANSREKIDTLIRQGNNAVILGNATAESYRSSAVGNSIGSALGWAGNTTMTSATFFKETPTSNINKKDKSIA
jgi:multidrug efflux pump subunit AcrA (membrane-fusion protein)